MKNSTGSRIASFLALLCLFLNLYVYATLNAFYLSSFKGVTSSVGLFSLSGTFLGFFLCPLFLPLTALKGPGFKRPITLSAAIIILLVLPNVILRSLGLELWIGSLPFRSVISLLSGMLYPLGAGLFFLSWRYTSNRSRGPGFFAIALSIGIIVNVFSQHMPVIAPGLDLSKYSVRLFDTMKWLMAAVGFFSVLCVLLLGRQEAQTEPPAIKTNWQLITRLIGIAVIYKTLNAVMEMRLFPLFRHSVMGEFRFYFLFVAALIPVFAFFAGLSMERFLRGFLLAAIALFIFMPCLFLFEGYPGFLMFMNFLLSLFEHLSWVVFTAALVEFYAGGFWFYAIAGAYYFTNFFSFIGPVANRYLPDGIEFTVLISGIAAVALLFLSFRIIVSKKPLSAEVTGELFPAGVSPDAYDASIEELLKKHGLTRREIEVGNLLVQGGLGTKEIAEKLFISPGTAKDHIIQIYKKFKVKSRGEFMALFVRR